MANDRYKGQLAERLEELAAEGHSWEDIAYTLRAEKGVHVVARTVGSWLKKLRDEAA